MPEILTAIPTESDDRTRAAIEDLMARGDKIELARLVQEEHPADVAQALDAMEFNQAADVFNIILLADVTLGADILIELEPATISRLYAHLSLQEWSWIFKELSDDEVVGILELFPDEARNRMMDRMPKKDVADVLERMNYPEDSAGRIMTNEFVSMDLNETVGAAIEKIRAVRDIDPMNLFYVFVTENRRLVGMVSLRRLLLGNKQTRLKDTMRTDVFPVHVHTDQEEVADVVRRHDEVSIPVVDQDGRLLGIITVDDVIDVIHEESEEDLYRIIGSSDEELMVAGNTRKIVALRLPWILASFFGSLLVAFVMKFTEKDVFGSVTAAKIFVFVPMICAMGGNVGVQSATIMARLLSTGNPNWREARRTMFKEARVGLSLGMICGALIGGFAFFWGGAGMLVTVMVSMVCAMTGAAATGTIIPIIMKKAGFDPALATGPFVISLNDLIATCAYFAIAYLLLDQWVP